MANRLPAAIALACLITFGLFWAMQALIGVTGELKEGGAPPSIDFVRLRKDNQPELKKREPPKREKPDQPPPPRVSICQGRYGFAKLVPTCPG